MSNKQWHEVDIKYENDTYYENEITGEKVFRPDVVDKLNAFEIKLNLLQKENKKLRNNIDKLRHDLDNLVNGV